MKGALGNSAKLPSTYPVPGYMIMKPVNYNSNNNNINNNQY